jgi:signal peptidase I
MIRLTALISLSLIAIFIFRFVLTPVRITGPSMFPTFKDGGINFVNRFAYLHNEPKRGDIVAIRFSKEMLLNSKHLMYVKRIVGMPGESVWFDNGKFYVNGKALEEPYLKFPSTDWESKPRTLGTNEYYVVGDNRSMPFDNHDKGAAERQRIIGKVLLQGGS